MNSTKKIYTAPKFQEFIITETLQNRDIYSFQNSINDREVKLLDRFVKLLKKMKGRNIIINKILKIKYRD